jgi:hypothetical protein
LDGLARGNASPATKALPTSEHQPELLAIHYKAGAAGSYIAGAAGSCGIESSAKRCEHRTDHDDVTAVTPHDVLNALAALDAEWLFIGKQR